MSFRLEYTEKEYCDKCGNKRKEKDLPIILIEQTSRADGRHIIFIHVSCLYKAINRANEKRQAAVHVEGVS